jgi:hypothetical protein
MRSFGPPGPLCCAAVSAKAMEVVSPSMAVARTSAVVGGFQCHGIPIVGWLRPGVRLFQPDNYFDGQVESFCTEISFQGVAAVGRVLIARAREQSAARRARQREQTGLRQGDCIQSCRTFAPDGSAWTGP